MGKIYAYCRISTSNQSIDRQHRNALDLYPNAIIVDEVFTGTKIEGRTNWNKLYNKVEKGDTIVFDSVSRMSRNAVEGFKLYKELFNKGVELVFIKEQHINTETYKKALTSNIQMTGTAVDEILKGINSYLLAIAEEQIKIAFEQSEKEVKDLQQRTREGLAVAKAEGKKIGREKGRKIITDKSIRAKEIILKHSKKFNGTLKDSEVMELAHISKATFYTYVKELISEYEEEA